MYDSNSMVKYGICRFSIVRFEMVESNSTVQTVEQQMSKPKGEQLFSLDWAWMIAS